ncbi:12702_t:CDS:2, partial [Racocetra fulgida]
CTHIVSTDGENINISWSWNGEMVAVGDKDDKISFIDPRKSPEPAIVNTYAEIDDIRDEVVDPVQVLRGHTANCYCIDFDPKQR